MESIQSQHRGSALRRKINRRALLRASAGGAAVAAAFALAGCGGQSSSAPVANTPAGGAASGGATTPAAATTSGAASAPASAATSAPRPSGTKKTTVEMWMWETEARWKQVEAQSGLNERFPDVEFKWTALPQADLHQKALTALAAGLPQGLPSIIRTSMNYYRAFANTKGIVDLSDQVKPHEKEILPAVWAGALINDKVYQVPDDTGVTLFGYRVDLFQKAGLPTEPDQVADLLKSYDDLITVGKTIQEKAGAKLFNMPPDNSIFNQLIRQDSTGYFDADGNVIFDSPYHVTAAGLVKKIWDAGLATTFDTNSPQMWQAYKDGQLATMFYPNWQDFTIIDNAPETKGKWRVTKLPAVQPGGKRAHADDGVCMVIPASLPDTQKRLATEIALYMKLTEKATVAHMKTFSGAFVSYVPGLQAMVGEPSPVLDGQAVYRLYLDAANTEGVLPWYRSSVFFSNAGDEASKAMFKILKENAPIEGTLKSTADAIRQLQQSKGTK